MQLILATFIALAALAVASPFSSVEERVALSPRAAQLTCPIVGSDGPVNVRTCASTSCSVYTTVNPGDNVIFTCWTVGQNVNGNPYWDRTGNGHYISEYYIGGSCPTGLPEC